MSTQLATLGSDRTAAFQLPNVPAVQLSVSCPAVCHLLVNDLKLDRPAADNAAADYVVPQGMCLMRDSAGAGKYRSTDSGLRANGFTASGSERDFAVESESRISVFGDRH